MSIRFFLDRGVGSKLLPLALREAGWELETMDERYGKEQSKYVADVDWIRDAAQAGDAILCKDSAVAVRPLEAHAIHVHDARVFTIANASITGPQMAEWVLGNEQSIFRWAKRSGPFVAGIHAATLKRIPLRLP